VSRGIGKQQQHIIELMHKVKGQTALQLAHSIHGNDCSKTMRGSVDRSIRSLVKAGNLQNVSHTYPRIYILPVERRHSKDLETEKRRKALSLYRDLEDSLIEAKYSLERFRQHLVNGNRFAFEDEIEENAIYKLYDLATELKSLCGYKRGN
jgi:hypothetical protein